MVIKRDKKKRMLDLVVIITSEHLNDKESRKGIVNLSEKKIDPRLLTSRGSYYKRVKMVRNRIREKLLQLGILVKVQASGVSFFILKIVCLSWRNICFSS